MALGYQSSGATVSYAKLANYRVEVQVHLISIVRTLHLTKSQHLPKRRSNDKVRV